MPFCKFCGEKFSWGRAEDRWVPLVPVGEEGDLLRTHQDADGQLRSEHRLICQMAGGPTVSVVKLAKPIPFEQILTTREVEEYHNRRRRS